MDNTAKRVSISRAVLGSDDTLYYHRNGDVIATECTFQSAPQVSKGTAGGMSVDKGVGM